jgi:hypothetical protein
VQLSFSRFFSRKTRQKLLQSEVNIIDIGCKKYLDLFSFSPIFFLENFMKAAAKLSSKKGGKKEN